MVLNSMRPIFAGDFEPFAASLKFGFFSSTTPAVASTFEAMYGPVPMGFRPNLLRSSSLLWTALGKIGSDIMRDSNGAYVALVEIRTV